MLYRRLFSCKSKLTMIVGTNDDNDDHDDNAPKEDEIGTRKKRHGSLYQPLTMDQGD